MSTIFTSGTYTNTTGGPDSIWSPNALGIYSVMIEFTAPITAGDTVIFSVQTSIDGTHHPILWTSGSLTTAYDTSQMVISPPLAFIDTTWSQFYLDGASTIISGFNIRYTVVQVATLT